MDLARWNRSAGRRWNHFLTLLERHYGVRPGYFRSVEVQEGHRREDGIGRGALHLHVLLRSPVVLSERTLRRLALEAGFGHSVVLDPLAPGSDRAAFYVSKYVTKSCDQRDDVPWAVDQVDEHGVVTSEPAPATFRTWSMSRNWGRSMAELRAAARARYVAEESLRAAREALAPPAPATAVPEPHPDD